MPSFKSYLILFFCSSFSILEIQAQVDKNISELFNEFAKKEKYTGNLLVADMNGHITYKESVGLADERFKVSHTQTTRFDIASVSKQFTAVLILKLFEKGLIDLNAPIIKYLPNYRKDTGTKVKVVDLLTHRSGIPNYTSLPGVWTDSLRNHYSFDYLLSQFCSENLEFEPDTKYKYNNSGYALLAAIIEQVAQKSFEVVLHEQILQPFELKNTGISSRETIIEHKAYGYVNQYNVRQQANYTFMPNLNGAGSMYSTTEDLLKWSIALHSGKVLEDSSYQLMTKAYSTDNKWVTPFKNGYGYGLGMFYNKADEVKNNEPWNVYFHSGHISGFSSFLAVFKEDNAVVALLSNTGGISTVEMNNLSVAIVKQLKKQKTESSGK